MAGNRGTAKPNRFNARTTLDQAIEAAINSGGQTVEEARRLITQRKQWAAAHRTIEAAIQDGIIKYDTIRLANVVALYQNPCKCWSLGLYYLQFPDRAQYNFMLSLTGIGWTENFGTAVLRSILSPLLIGEKGLPWAAPGGPYGRAQSLLPQTGMGGVAR